MIWEGEGGLGYCHTMVTGYDVSGLMGLRCGCWREKRERYIDIYRAYNRLVLEADGEKEMKNWRGVMLTR